MEFELLRQALRKTEAGHLRVEYPCPLNAPALIFDRPASPVRVGTEVMTLTIGVRNVGDLDCFLAGISSPTPGISASISSAGNLFSARTPESGAYPINVQFDPFALSDDERETTLDFNVQPVGGGLPVVCPCRLGWERERVNGPVLLAESSEVVFDSVPMLNAHLFAAMFPSAKGVLLLLERGPKGVDKYPQQYPMIRQDGGEFVAAVPLIEGEHYAYRFCADGVCCPDTQWPGEEHVAGLDTYCSPLDVPVRRRKKLRVRNSGSAELNLHAQSSAGWLDIAPRALHLQRGETSELEIRVSTDSLSLGNNAGEIILQANSPQTAVRERKIAVRAIVKAPGPIPDFDNKPLDFGSAYLGCPTTKIINIRNIGSGVLKGRIVTPDTDLRGTEFQIPEGSGPTGIPLLINPTMRLAENPGDSFKSSELLIESETPLVNRRSLPLKIQYRVEAMQLDPAEINFQTSPGLTKKFLVVAKAGNNQPIDAEIGQGSLFPEWLEVQLPRPGEIEIVIHGEGWSGRADQTVAKEIRLRDRKSGLVGSITLRGEFLVPKATLDKSTLTFGNLPAVLRKGSIVKVSNTGHGSLVLKRIVLDHEWLSVVLPNNPPGSETAITIQVDSSKCSPGRNRGVVEFHTNDPVSPCLAVTVEAKV